MTIHEHDRVSAGRDGESRKPALSDHALVDRLSAGEPYAVAFGGQGGAWLENLEELVSSAGIEHELATLVAEAEVMLEPIADELVVVRPIGFEPLRWVRAHAAGEAVPSTMMARTKVRPANSRLPPRAFSAATRPCLCAVVPSGR